MTLRDRLAALSRQAGRARPDGAAADASARPVPTAVTPLAERLLRAAGTARSAPEAATPATLAALAARLGGVVAAEHLIRIEHVLPLGTRHGRQPLAALADCELAWLAPRDPPCARELAMIDTETTGLAGGTGTVAFLTGLAHLDGDALRVTQWLLTSFAGERAMLSEFAAALGARALASYNGRGFDAPLLAARYRLARLPDPLAGRAHHDLLHPARAAFAGRWPDCRLQTAERELLGFERRDDIPGHEVPLAWTDFLRARRADRLAAVVLHNRLDIVSLAALLPALATVYNRPRPGVANARALARRQLRARRADLALAHLEADAETLDARGRLELAAHYRRAGDAVRAAAIWQSLAAAGCIEAIEALAKHCEHGLRDPAAALEQTERLCAAQPDQLAHRRRLARLAAKSAAAPRLL